MTAPTGVTVEPLGDRAVLLTLAGDREGCNRRIAQLTAALLHEQTRAPPGAIVDVVPTMVSLAVFFDPRAASSHAMQQRLLALARDLPDEAISPEAGRIHAVPTVYDGPDLTAAASRLGLDPGELIARHSGREYRVRFLGFAPGFAYLGPLDPALVLPRRTDPRRRVPAGSVAIASDQTAIYPLDTPGGWHLVGRTAVRPFDPAGSPPSLFAPGDRVRFEPVAP